MSGDVIGTPTVRDRICFHRSSRSFVSLRIIPLETLDVLQFSKWIRYAIGIVIGAEGDLSSNPNSLDIVDYNLNTQRSVLSMHIVLVVLQPSGSI